MIFRHFPAGSRDFFHSPHFYQPENESIFGIIDLAVTHLIDSCCPGRSADHVPGNRRLLFWTSPGCCRCLRQIRDCSGSRGPHTDRSRKCRCYDQSPDPGAVPGTWHGGSGYRRPHPLFPPLDLGVQPDRNRLVRRDGSCTLLTVWTFRFPAFYSQRHSFLQQTFRHYSVTVHWYPVNRNAVHLLKIPGLLTAGYIRSFQQRGFCWLF